MKSTRVLLLLTVLPFAAALAQQPAAGPPANPMTTAFKNRTAATRRNIAQAFDSIPESMFGFKPTPAQLSFGYIAAHVASDNYLFCNNYGDMKATISDKEKTTPDSVKALWPKDSLVARLKASNAFCDAAIGQLDDTNLGAILTLPGPNNTTRQVSRFNYVIGHAMDQSDHYSQLANYMRLKGITPPTALPRPGRGGL